MFWRSTITWPAPKRKLRAPTTTIASSGSVIAVFPEVTIFTEDAIKAFLKKEGIDPKNVIGKKKWGIDLYAFDRRRNLITPVDILTLPVNPNTWRNSSEIF